MTDDKPNKDSAVSEAMWRQRAQEAAGRRFPEGAEIELLPPHASRRRYARIAASDGERSEILMLRPDRATAEEVGGSAAAKASEDPFVSVQRWLAANDVPVPALHEVDDDANAIWLEDLGDTNLDDWIGGDAERRVTAYERATALLLGWMERLEPATAPAEVVGRRFDAELLRWELDHYVEWRLEEHLGVELSTSTRSELDEHFDALVEQIVAVPTTVIHRDFQSHNIMVRGGEPELTLIDFQDAMIGPVVYDAVALLRDSYVAIPDAELDRLVARFAGNAASLAATGSATADELVHWFHLQTVQRKLKDAGRFVYIDRVKGNEAFLPYIPTSLSYVRGALRRLRDWTALQALLAACDPGLRIDPPQAPT